MESECDINSPECICPCGCGCQNDINGHDLPFTDGSGNNIPVGDVGMCASCSEGAHEIPPGDLTAHIAVYESILLQMKYVKAVRDGKK